LPDFDPQKVLIDWKESHGFTFADATAGVYVFGRPAPGKPPAQNGSLTNLRLQGTLERNSRAPQ